MGVGQCNGNVEGVVHFIGGDSAVNGFPWVIDAVLRDLDRQVGVLHDRLARKARHRSEAPGTVQKVFFLVLCGRSDAKPLRTMQWQVVQAATCAGMLDVDAMVEQCVASDTPAGVSNSLPAGTARRGKYGDLRHRPVPTSQFLDRSTRQCGRIDRSMRRGELIGTGDQRLGAA